MKQQICHSTVVVKNLLVYMVLFFISVTVVSCEKVIDLKIPDAEQQYVIEAIVSDGGCRVNLSQTLNFADSNEFRPVSGATITVSEDGTTPVTLIQTNGGFYRANLFGKPGHTYTLNVAVNGKTFTATSTIPQKVRSDSLYITERLFLGRKRKIATVEFTDPPGLGNVYRFVQYVNTKKENTTFITDDHLIDGRRVVYEMLVFSDDEYTLKTGDQLRVEMYTITPFMYNYWYSLAQGALGQNQGASPGNPVNPFQAGAIGYFSTHTISLRSLTVR